MGDCPKCGFANPGAVDFCPNPQCRTYLGWAGAAPPPRPFTPQQPPYPSPGPPTERIRPVPVPPTGPPQRRGVRVTVEPAELTVDPGGEVTTMVTVRNLGTRVEEFQLMPGGPAAVFAAITPATLSIYPDDEQRAVARFAPVRGPQSPAGVAPFEIVARSVIHTDVIDIALFAVLKPGTPTVPQVADRTQSVAEQELRNAGYVIDGATPISDPKAAGVVIRSDPAAGSPLEEGERVQLFVSTGPCNPVCRVTVPATKGRTEAEARALLGDAGFTVGQVVPGPSDLPAGTVKETSPAELTEAPTNVAVVVFTSSGASLKLPPDQLAGFQGQSAANVKKALGNSFRVEQVPERSNEFAAGKVLRAIQDAGDPKRMTLFVAAPTATDLVALAGRASWRSSAGPLRFPGRVTDARGAVLARNKVLVMVPPKTGNGSVTGVFTLSANQKIIAGDRLKANVGMLAGGAGQVQFAIKVGGQVLPDALTAGPGQLVPLDAPLDAFIGANTIEITVTGTPSALPLPAPGNATATPAPGATPTTKASEAVWQNLRIEGTVKNP